MRNSVTENLRYGDLFYAKADVLRNIKKYLSGNLIYHWEDNAKPKEKPGMKGCHVFGTIYDGVDRKLSKKKIELIFEEFDDGSIKFHFIKFM